MCVHWYRQLCGRGAASVRPPARFSVTHPLYHKTTQPQQVRLARPDEHCAIYMALLLIEGRWDW